MSFNDFYMDSGGNDLNAGSVRNSAALVTDTGGTYNQGTGAGGTDRYTASAGTPFSATVVGEWISVYTAGATAATFVGQTTAVNAGGASVDISLTAIYGTRPANASTKTARTGGSWAGLAPAASAGLSAVTAIPASTRVNIAAGTYANTSTSRAFNWIGTATATLWMRGYNATPGDLDTIPLAARTPGTDMPSLTWTTGRVSAIGAQQLWTSLSVLTTANVSSAAATAGANCRFHRCRFENQGNNALSGAFASGSLNRFTQCWFKSLTTATQTCQAQGAFADCAFEGGISNVVMTATVAFLGCTFANAATQSLLGAASPLTVRGCTFYNPGVDALKFATLPTEADLTNNLFHTVPGTALNNASGANTNLIQICSNDYYSVGTQVAGLGDSPQFDALTESADPCVAVASLNFTLKTSASGYQKAAPQLFEGQANNVGYASVGAVPPQNAAGPVVGCGFIRGLGRVA